MNYCANFAGSFFSNFKSWSDQIIWNLTADGNTQLNLHTGPNSLDQTKLNLILSFGKHGRHLI